MKATPLHRALPIVAAALGRKFGVQVAIQGNRAATDGNTIVLPVLPDEGVVRDVAWGYLAHEAAHVRYTDFETYQKSATSPLRGALMNSVEDVRIESALAHEYPGTRETIGTTVAQVLKEGGFDPDTSSPAGVLTSHVLLKLRCEVLNQEALAPLAQQADEALRKTFPKGVVTRLHGLLAEVRELRMTADALRLTDSIIRMLKEEQEKAKQQKPDPETQRDGEAEREEKAPDDAEAASAPSDAEAGAQDRQDGQAQAGSSTDPQGSAAADSEPTQGQGDGAGSSSRINDERSGNIGTGAGDGYGGDPDAIAKALEASAGDVPKDVFARAAELLEAKAQEGIRQHGWTQLPSAEAAASRDALKQKVLSEARANSNRLRAQLTGLVQSAREEARWSKRAGRRLDRSRLHRLAIGDTRVFVAVNEHQAPNTAVHLLVDVSGSMDEAVPQTNLTRCRLALDSACALSLALESIHGVNPAVTAFPGIDTYVQVLQRHGERVARVAGRFGQHPRGGTPMYEALWYVAAQLVLQREPRKLLIVLTDGDPSRPANVKRLVGELENRGGIEIYGVGIATMVVKSLFRSYRVINDVRELRTALFEIARAALLAA